MVHSSKKRVRIILRDGRPIDIPMQLIDEVQLPIVELSRGFTGLRFKDESELNKKIAEMWRKAGFV